MRKCLLLSGMSFSSDQAHFFGKFHIAIGNCFGFRSGLALQIAQWAAKHAKQCWELQIE